VSSCEGEAEKDGDYLLPKVNAEDFYASKSVHNVIRKRKANYDERIDEAYKFMKTYLNMLKNGTDTVSVTIT
jgi:predicted AAA+ superfamily ATPase